MRSVTATLTLLALVLSPSLLHAETVKTRLNARDGTFFSVVPEESGVVSITVIAKKRNDFVLLATDGDDEITWCSGVSDERMIRCEFSGLADDVVQIGLVTVRGATQAHINVTGPVNEVLHARRLGATPSIARATFELRDRVLRGR